MPFKSRDGIDGNEKEEESFPPCLLLHSSDITVQMVFFLRKNSSFL